ncbi:M50 family metallopeptidase [uncultured Friedmanniella sp.]|uniref:M50 family metallopeptidase n=1 Tax=uncultured Friedmanniella sp. TaxID=335381 RepID=UPI0035CC3CBF
MTVLAEIWRRAVSEQPAPDAALVVGAAVVALVAVLHPTLWRATRLLVTITHEGGHAVAALLAGRRLRGIRLHADTSGLTVSSGRAAGPGMVLMLLAGYLGPAVVGLGAVALLLSGHALGLLWAFVLLLALMLLQIRNLYGFALVVAVGAGLAALSWYAAPTTQTAVATLLTWLLLLAAPKPVLELGRQHRAGRATHSDAGQLHRLTRLPVGLWIGVFGLLNLGGLAIGTALLVPALATLAGGR